MLTEEELREIREDVRRTLASPPSPHPGRTQREIGPRHEEIVDQLVAEGCERIGFNGWLRRTFGVHTGIRPDAFRFGDDTLTVYEVVVGNPLSRAKRREYVAIRDELVVAHGWSLVLVVVSVDGERKADSP